MARYTETVFPVKKVLNLTTEQAERIREYRFAHRIESENEAIRRLIEAGLKTTQVSHSGGGEPGEPDKPAPAAQSAVPPKKKK